jgi:glycosyltransferase involved in cell wall biosynthesis
MRVAIVHDYLTQRGGAERVVLAFCRMFPDAPVFTSLYDPDTTFTDFTSYDVRPSFLQRLPHRGGLFRAYLPVYPWVFRRAEFRSYDIVLSSSSGWAHGVDSGRVPHVCYCHAPAKWLWRSSDYFGTSKPAARAARIALAPVLAPLRAWDRRASMGPSVYVANSRVIADQIAAVYGRSATVVPPPVELRHDREVPATEPYYVAVARNLAYKRLDIAVRVCSKRGTSLIVVGDGPERRSLKRIAGPTVSFRSGLSDDELADLYAGCRALIQCGREDFGIAPLEANTAGRPVVAFGHGGALDTVIDGRTGVLFSEPTDAALHDALDRLDSTAWDPNVLRAHARSFGEDQFVQRMHQVIRGAIGEEVVSPQPLSTSVHRARRGA